VGVGDVRGRGITFDISAPLGAVAERIGTPRLSRFFLHSGYGTFDNTRVLSFCQTFMRTLAEDLLAEPLLQSLTGAYSVIVFGLFRLLGYRFSPRLADIGGTRLWRIDPHADYGEFNDMSRHKINLPLIAADWDDLLRLAGSLKLGALRLRISCA
jgi:hypothetical protein